jgi:flagellar motility protein MotE (MotC chaperone)
MKTARSLTWGVFVVSAVACAAVFAQAPPRPPSPYQADPTSQAPAYPNPAVAPAADAWHNGWGAYHWHQSQSGQLARSYVKAEGEDEKRSLRKKLQDVLTREFDEHVKQQQKELEDVEKRITKMRSLAERRLEAKNKIVDRRIQQLLDEAEGLGWSGSNSGLEQDLAAYAFDLPTRVYDARPGTGHVNRSQEAVQLVRSYAKAETADDKREIRKKLADILSEQFDQHSKQQEKELKDLEKQIASLRTLIKKRGDAKSAIVDRRVEQLILDAEGLGWGTPGAANLFHSSVPAADILVAPPATAAPKE